MLIDPYLREIIFVGTNFRGQTKIQKKLHFFGTNFLRFCPFSGRISFIFLEILKDFGQIWQQSYNELLQGKKGTRRVQSINSFVSQRKKERFKNAPFRQILTQNTF